MGQKVNPVGIRLGITQKWNSTWYADKKSYANYLISDLKVRSYLQNKFGAAGISSVQIERLAKNARVVINVSKPGIILGKKGSDVEILRSEIGGMLSMPTHVSIVEVKKPDLDAKLVAKGIAEQLERRIMFRKAMKRAVQSALKAGALGVKISVSGRLGGAEIARTEWYREGRVPLHTLRANIDYSLAEAKTTYGIIGVKVWIFKGEIFDKKDVKKEKVEIRQSSEE